MSKMLKNADIWIQVAYALLRGEDRNICVRFRRSKPHAPERCHDQTQSNPLVFLLPDAGGHGHSEQYARARVRVFRIYGVHHTREGVPSRARACEVNMS